MSEAIFAPICWELTFGRGYSDDQLIDAVYLGGHGETIWFGDGCIRYSGPLCKYFGVFLMSLDAIVLDVETLNDPANGGGWATSRLGVGIAVVYESRRDRFLFYDGRRPAALAELRARVLQADVVAGYNIWAFDLPVIFGLDRAEWETIDNGRATCYHETAAEIIQGSIVFDAFRVIRLASGASPRGSGSGLGTSLHEVVMATLGWQARGGKSLPSEQLPGMIADGRAVDVAAECLRHVMLERDLCRFMLQHGYAVTGNGSRAILSGVHDFELWAGCDAIERTRGLYPDDLMI